MVAIGDMSPSAGEADGWLRLHVAGSWTFFVVADTAGATGTVDVELSLYDPMGLLPDNQGSALQTTTVVAANAPVESAELPTGIHEGTLEAGDETLSDGAYFDVFVFDLRQGERLRAAALSSQYDLYLAAVPVGGEPIKDESSGLAGTAAQVDYTAPAAVQVQLGVFSKNSEEGPYHLIIPEVLSGTPCQQLERLDVADPWSLPGVEDSRVHHAMRSRVLGMVMPWSSLCEVESMGIDLGASCSTHAADENAARKVYGELKEPFQACHAGWALEEADDGMGVSATLNGHNHRLVVMGDAMTGWSVSMWAWRGE